MTIDRQNTKIIIVGGGGTIGSSTALHLLRSGYKASNITVLDVYPIPSLQSAGHDRNKIMSVQLRNPPDLPLSLEAFDMWRNDELFKPYFHNVGVVCYRSTGIDVLALRKLTLCPGKMLFFGRWDCEAASDERSTSRGRW